MINFKDHFSQQSDWYLKYRPRYPDELYTFLATLTENHGMAWDCGTGNGQAAVGLAEFYDKILASDPSEQQIKNAMPHERVKYVVEKAEQTTLLSDSVDLITIANALHWFEFDPFYKEAKRVLKKNGVIAAWAYGTPTLSEEVDVHIKNYHDHTLNDFWQYENRLVEMEYTSIPFPFPEIKCPEFLIQKEMNLADMIGYLNTWSATQRFINKHGFNPTDRLFNELKDVWTEPESAKNIRWKLTLKVGRNA